MRMDYKKILSGNIVMKIMMARRRKSLVVDNTCVGNDNFIPINKWIDRSD
jgi:hypothetical protein